MTNTMKAEKIDTSTPSINNGPIAFGVAQPSTIELGNTITEQRTNGKPRITKHGTDTNSAEELRKPYLIYKWWN